MTACPWQLITASMWQLPLTACPWQLMTACQWQLVTACTWQVMTACTWQLISASTACPWQVMTPCTWQLMTAYTADDSLPLSADDSLPMTTDGSLSMTACINSWWQLLLRAAFFGASLHYIRQDKSEPNSEKFSFETDRQTDGQKKSAGIELRFAAKKF